MMNEQDRDKQWNSTISRSKLASLSGSLSFLGRSRMKG